MKKTMIAMAVAGVVAAPMASADVSISGVVEMEYMDLSNSGFGFDGVGESDNALSFSASEDLGNGLTAFANITLDTDGATTKDEKVGISGEFGTVVFGKMEDFTESKAQAMISTIGNNTGLEIDAVADRRDGAVAYVSPTVSGLTFGLAGYTTEQADTDNFDATDIMVSYANGPFTAIVTHERMNPAAATALASGEKTLSIGGTLTMGDLKLAVLNQERTNVSGTTANDHTDVMWKADYTMGANKFTVGWNEDELTTGATDNNTTVLEASHNFSSRTYVYGGIVSDDNNDSSDTDVTYFGMGHKF